LWLHELYSYFEVCIAHGSQMLTHGVTNADISAFVTPWHQALYLGVEEIGVKCLLLGCDSMLNVGVCCILLTGQVLLRGSKETESLGAGSGLLGG
jgi:hypothetical protein